jgi:hypothetical protein
VEQALERKGLRPQVFGFSEECPEKNHAFPPQRELEISVMDGLSCSGCLFRPINTVLRIEVIYEDKREVFRLMFVEVLPRLRPGIGLNLSFHSFLT